MHFHTFTTSLCLLLSTSVSVLGLTIPDDVTGDITYSLTLVANPSRILVSKYPELAVDTFDPTKPWDAGNVGPDNGRRWNLYNGMKSLHNVDSNGFLRYDDETISGSMKTDGQLFYIENSHIRLVPEGNGIKIEIVDENSTNKLWVNESGKPDKENAAVWLLTETVTGTLADDTAAVDPPSTGPRPKPTDVSSS